MPLDLLAFAQKLKKYREQFQLSVDELSSSTGISIEDIRRLESAKRQPTGDEILVLADYFLCDYKFFISNEPLASFEQTETLFRRYGDELSQADRWAIQEILFFADNEAFLSTLLEQYPIREFSYRKSGHHYKTHGIEAAAALRQFLGYSFNKVGLNIYEDFRSIGIRVYRRRLSNPNISGFYIFHPVAGKCIVINYDEDIYRQRFTAAHEAGHAILDSEEDIVVSFANYQQSDLREIRANTFASHFLMPPDFLITIPQASEWTDSKAIEWASNLKVSTTALAYALKEAGLVDRATENVIKSVRVPSTAKQDPELSTNNSPNSLQRKKLLLEKGLSTHYVTMCFNAYRNGLISKSRLAEMLLMSTSDLGEVATLYKVSLT